MKRKLAFAFLLSVPIVILAQNVGTVGPNGKAIRPSEEGNLLVIEPAASGLPVYTFVKTGGEPAVIMTPNGDALTPQQAWEMYGGQAKSTKVIHVPPPKLGTFSVPNVHH